MPDKTLLKTVRFNRETFEALRQLAENEERPIDALISEALDTWLEAKAQALMEAEMERERRESTFDYDEFWDGVDLD
ncbi:hypothetical protein [Nitratifractor sp.]|uniref:hypothetical protein n=1 Tax=Nitratifractor sp. TaxID=2268144 RepID=UPI0025D3F703|nr:hypothetical protein [Nitratifractor sp.]